MRKAVKSMIDDALAVITAYSIDEARSLRPSLPANAQRRVMGPRCAGKRQLGFVGILYCACGAAWSQNA